MKIWYEEEFAQIEAKHQKELKVKNAELNKKDAEMRMNEAQYRKELAKKTKFMQGNLLRRMKKSQN